MMIHQSLQTLDPVVHVLIKSRQILTLDHVVWILSTLQNTLRSEIRSAVGDLRLSVKPDWSKIKLTEIYLNLLVYYTILFTSFGYVMSTHFMLQICMTIFVLGSQWKSPSDYMDSRNHKLLLCFLRNKLCCKKPHSFVSKLIMHQITAA